MKRFIVITLLISFVMMFSGCNYSNVANNVNDSETSESEEESYKEQYEKTKEELTAVYEELNETKEKLEEWQNRYSPLIDLDAQIAENKLLLLSLQAEVEQKQAILDSITPQIDAAQLEANRKATEGTTVYEDELVKINYVKIKNDSYDDAVVFLIENKTDVNITIQCDAIALDGFSYNNGTMSDDVAPQSKGYVYAKFDDIDITDPSFISGQLRVIDFSREYLDPYHYDVSFVNVAV